MSYYKLFVYSEGFDFLNDELPGNFLVYYFGEPLQTFRKLMYKRTNEEISYALGSLDWLLKEGSRLLFPKSLKEASDLGGSFSNRVRALREIAESNEVDLTEQSEFPEPKWSDYFAVLSLAYILEVIHPENFVNMENDYGLIAGDPDYLFTAEWAMECTEAIRIAEWYRDLESAKPRIFSERGKKGAKVRAGRYAEVREECLKLYDEKYSHLSNRQAAKIIFKELSPELQFVIRSDEPEKTIEKWIGPHKKSKSEQ